MGEESSHGRGATAWGRSYSHVWARVPAHRATPLVATSADHTVGADVHTHTHTHTHMHTHTHKIPRPGDYGVKPQGSEISFFLTHTHTHI